MARVYDRVLGIYDLYTSPMEAWAAERHAGACSPGPWTGPELGIGTGVGLGSYPSEVELTGIDISPRMLERARRRAAALSRPVSLEIADIEDLPYPDASFDTVTASCVFCSVPDPVQGLREARRVTRPDGQVLLYEHVRPRNLLLAKVADLISPVTRRTFGPELNRRTEINAEQAGLVLSDVQRQGIWRAIVAIPG